MLNNNTLNGLSEKITKIAEEHGWWNEERTFGEIIALCHSELSEALEEYRNGEKNLYYTCAIHDKIQDGKLFCGGGCEDCSSGKPEGIGVELADCMIRILDYCGHKGIDIDDVMQRKIEYNKHRPYRHGGKVI